MISFFEGIPSFSCNTICHKNCWHTSSQPIVYCAMKKHLLCAGYHLRVTCCFLLPAAQLVVSISHPSWISLPFFVFSCIGLVDWSLTSNFLGLFR